MSRIKSIFLMNRKAYRVHRNEQPGRDGSTGVVPKNSFTVHLT
jgi:hypothetical protein